MSFCVCASKCACMCKTAKFEKCWFTVISPVKFNSFCMMHLKELKTLSGACHPNSLLKTSEGLKHDKAGRCQTFFSLRYVYFFKEAAQESSTVSSWILVLAVVLACIVCISQKNVRKSPFLPLLSSARCCPPLSSHCQLLMMDKKALFLCLLSHNQLLSEIEAASTSERKGCTSRSCKPFI